MKGKVVLVTGAASGIGAACARRFAEEGATVVLADRDNSDVLARELDALAVTVDVRDEVSVARLYSIINERHSRLDVLAHLAGVAQRGLITAFSVADWDTVVDINLKGTFLCCRGAIPLLRKSGGGAIVTIGSELAYVAEKNISVYSATKAAVVHFTRCLANDHGADGIRVNCVCPGPVQTPMLERGIKDSPDPALTRRRTEQTTILGRLGQPVEIANVVYFLASDEASFITGSAILADGGVTSKAT
ncbi:MAG: SDR family NAD(P)-dependent oxidoreductase [Arenicellales bacterium]|nr:SDR family NAD(P)-dependent oxidoreductase [Arenicellales bacterium]